MTTSPRTTSARKLWHLTLRAARALQTLHDEQVRMWELYLQTSRAPVDQAGPLTWTSSLDGPRLTGSHLPTRQDASAGGPP